ncbi:META domain-containing protein [Acinetobacter sp. S40]|uniref:META domain-containing protein n=1 Tax=unclassified Acinetobacter TaxID=196816 RepID=UPI00190E24F6|nr:MULTISPECIES: META domain-containing protein [unclassified Acinetobacter]MBJ9984609.1 META domain-containing protein [Acinetobacter sp. S40]MBK0062326.1 META domain-containing protein [Acinetobacter sp. S55]MBK0066130.1 META domain-containing protein [Acinetobacter sp. S54]
MLKKIIITTGIVSALTMAGCATMTNPSTDRNLAMLQNKSWLVTEINGVEYKANPAQTTNIPSLMFDNSALSGSDGCNRIMGGYTVKGSQIAFTQLAKTQMACLNATDVPEKFSNALEQTTSYKVSDKKLELMNSDGKVVIQLKNK